MSLFVGRRAQACDEGECEPVTVMTEPQRTFSGSWELLVRFDSRPNYLQPLDIKFLYLKHPDVKDEPK